MLESVWVHDPLLALQAIIESDPFSITLKDMNKARSLGEDFAKQIGCSDIECLYSKVGMDSLDWYASHVDS